VLGEDEVLVARGVIFISSSGLQQS
jgi:hypothetical protein